MSLRKASQFGTAEASETVGEEFRMTDAQTTYEHVCDGLEMKIGAKT